MKIGIHPIKGSFSDRWISYCEENQIEWKPVDCYKSDIIKQLMDCDALMWPFSQNCPKAWLFAKQLIYSIEASGKKVFPNFNTIWHFDDKLGQKYLLESISAPLAPTWVFFEKAQAEKWISNTVFPKVFKLRGGAGSQNVELISNRRMAKRVIRKAFGRGFPAYNPVASFKERWRRFIIHKSSLKDLLEGMARFIVPPPYSRIKGREKGYVYFQEYIAGNNFDIRTIVIGNKAFAIRRNVRKNDFRASGSGNIQYNKSLIDLNIIKLSFEIAERLKSQCVAFDFVYKDKEPIVLEISYGYSQAGYYECPGYWDNELIWHEGSFNPYGWMVDDLVRNQ